MTTKALPVSKSLLESPGKQPCISLFLPFEPKMSLQTELEYRLKLATRKIETELLARYTASVAVNLLQRLKTLIKKLSYNTHKKSIAIFISPIVEKVYYLDMPMEEKIIIDDSFEIRDIVYSKKELHKYLVLVLSSKQSRIYIGNNNQLIRIVSDVPEHVSAYINDIPSRVANFSDPSRRKEVMLDKFLYHIDEGLSLLLQAYPLPLFVLGTLRTTGHFKKTTRNGHRVVAYIKGNYGEANERQLYNVLAPLLSDWKKIKEKDILQQIESAMNARKLSIGIEDVWKEAMHKRGRLLVIEKNYTCSARRGDKKDSIYLKRNDDSGNADIKDVVDDVIEKVLANGGDVEFVDPGVLADYKQIVLIDFYQC